MADIEQLHKALINADAAGDTEAAKTIAAEISLMNNQAKANAWSQRNTDFVDTIKTIPKGIFKGFTDITGGATQAIAHGAQSVFPSLKDSVSEYDKILADREKSFNADTANNPVLGKVSRIGGNVIATLPLNSLRVAEGVTALPNIVNGIFQGGTIGGLQPVTEGDYSTEKKKQITTGAAAGGAGSVIGNLAARLIKPNVSPEVKILLDSGVTPTPGQIMGGALGKVEDKLTSVPILGDAISYGQRNAIEDLNRAAYKRALNPIGEKSLDNVGREGVADVSNKLRAAYQDLLPKLSFKADPQFVSDLQKISMMSKNLPEAQQRQLATIVNSQLVNKMTPQGNMSGESLKAVESELNRFAKGYSGDSSFDNRQLGDAVNEIINSIRQGLQRSNPQYAKELSAINEGYANYVRIRDAASRIGSKEGIFTPAQLSASVRSGDKSVGKGNFARGSALMQDLSDAGVKVLGSKYPDSGSIGRALLATGAVGSGAINPAIPASLITASVPYAPGVRELMAALLAKRPDIAAPISEAVRSSGPLIGASSAPFLVGSERGN